MSVRVAELMTTSVLTTTPATKATDAALAVALHNIAALPVLDHGRLVGMFTEDDLLRAGSSTGRSDVLVGAVMSPASLLATPGCDAAELAREMRNHQVLSVPVVDNGRLVGIITRRDLRRYAPRSDQTANELVDPG